jgi:hypothetical protein
LCCRSGCRFAAVILAAVRQRGTRGRRSADKRHGRHFRSSSLPSAAARKCSLLQVRSRDARSAEAARVREPVCVC